MSAVYAATYDLGSGVSYLRNWGPPEVEQLGNIAGNGSASEKVSQFWECVEALSFKIVANGTAGSRFARLRWFAGEAVPFAQAIAQAAVTASLTVEITFATDVQQGGAVASGALVVPIPKLLLLPGWSVTLDVLGGLAGDALSQVRVYRQRLQPVEVEEFERYPSQQGVPTWPAAR